jgi:hypothetical protein
MRKRHYSPLEMPPTQGRVESHDAATSVSPGLDAAVTDLQSHRTELSERKIPTLPGRLVEHAPGQANVLRRGSLQIHAGIPEQRLKTKPANGGPGAGNTTARRCRGYCPQTQAASPTARA